MNYTVIDFKVLCALRDRKTALDTILEAACATLPYPLSKGALAYSLGKLAADIGSRGIQPLLDGLLVPLHMGIVDLGELEIGGHFYARDAHKGLADPGILDGADDLRRFLEHFLVDAALTVFGHGMLLFGVF